MIRLSVDDGCASDIRIAAIAEKYEIPTVFYWPVEWQSLAYDMGYNPLTYDEACYIANRHEIGSHTITHRHLTNLHDDVAEREIMESKFMLENLFDVKITKFCPPRGYTSPALSTFTQQIYESQRLTRGRGLVHIHPDSGANNNMPWREFYKMQKEQYEDIELWCHSWELDKFSMWDDVEAFFNENISS